MDTKYQALLDTITILLFGSTGSGKTYLIGELAEHVFATQKKYTMLYTADRGGMETIRPYIDVGLIRPQIMFGNPWLWLDHAVKGHTWDGAKWTTTLDPTIGAYCYEGMTSFADEGMKNLREEAAAGTNIGGSASISFVTKDKVSNESMKIGSNNMSHYMVVQGKIYDTSALSQNLPGIVLWTAGDSRGEDDVAGGVVGPQIAGKAKTSEAPRWFKYCFQVASEVMPGGEPKHVLYTDRHIEMSAKGAVVFANARVPKDGTDVKIPSKIEPASLVQVLTLLDKRRSSATDQLRKRLGL